MPTEHKKKKIKTEESKEVHPLSYHIDDRVELIRQIFGCLKSKTIKSIAPDFLQVIFYHIISICIILTNLNCFLT